ncbi:MAG: class II aldolase/adducin family protein [Sphingobacteriales bacterium]|nr:class II aldolase/adducin family protein [Sphingobacteriales bacterium]
MIAQYSIEKNCLQYIGVIKASSEALIHAALYALYPQINNIVHIHYFGNLATTTKQARLYHQTNYPKQKYW